MLGVSANEMKKATSFSIALLDTSLSILKLGSTVGVSLENRISPIESVGVGTLTGYRPLMGRFLFQRAASLALLSAAMFTWFGSAPLRFGLEPSPSPLLKAAGELETISKFRARDVRFGISDRASIGELGAWDAFTVDERAHLKPQGLGRVSLVIRLGVGSWTIQCTSSQLCRSVIR